MPHSLTAKFMLGITGIVAAVLFLSLIWDFEYQQDRADEQLLAKASLVAKQQQATRSFLSDSSHPEFVHGGEARPLAPHEVGKGVSDLFADLSKSQVKQTHLTVRNPKNEPDAFERAALEWFASDPESDELWQRVTMEDGTPAFRYMMALQAEESCLICHGTPAGELDKTGYPKEGMELGDLAGAISVILPMRETLNAARAESIRMAILVLALAALTLLLIWFLLWRQVSSPLAQLADVATAIGMGQFRVKSEQLRPLQANRETAVVADAFEQMSTRLQELYDGLEQKVAERTQELREANRELERASRHKSEFLTMVSHEFRTPLTSIITFTELLLGDERLKPEQRENLTDVLESSQHLLRMINDLLDLSRLEAGKVKLFKEMLAVPDLMRDVARTVHPLTEKKAIFLAVEANPDLPLVHADELRVMQILMNLLGNAVKFTPEGGRVRVTAREAGEMVEIAVSDTGIGIAPEEQGRIFEAFRQAGRQRPEGSGLGLALARSLVELHGGRIWVESRLGEGATFTFTLPIWSEQGRGSYDERSEASPGG
ncbi:MAG: ATP-binding protein [Bacillota bacterium]